MINNILSGGGRGQRMQGGDVQGVVDGKLCGQARTIILCAAKHNATVNIESGNTPGYTEGQTLKARR